MRHAGMPFEKAEIWPSKQTVLLAQTSTVSRWLIRCETKKMPKEVRNQERCSQ
jgi:hypothetical protein